MEYQDNKVTLYADGGEMGQGDAVIDAKVDGDFFKTAFNGLLMKDALSTVDKAFVIKQQSEHKPLVVSPLDRQKDVIQVIMPMQVRVKQDD